MGTITLMQDIKSAAHKLKGSKLKRLNAIEQVLERIKEATLLASKEEVMLLVAVFDRQCAGQQSNLDDLSDYYECSALEVMEFVPDIKALQAKGYIEANNRKERNIVKMNFSICPDVFAAIIEGERIQPVPQMEVAHFDSADLCEMVHNFIEERSNEQITTRRLFSLVEKLEEEHRDMDLIKSLKAKIDSIDARVLYYEMCMDFTSDYEGGKTSMNSTLKDMYGKMSEGVWIKKHIMDGTHPLVKNDLMEMCSLDDLRLTNNGMRLLLGDAASAFVKSLACQDNYAFINNVAEYVDDLPYHPSMLDFNKLYTDVMKLETANKHLTFIESLQKLLDNNVHRLIFYLICKEAMNSFTYSINELHEIFPKLRELDVKREFKRESHMLQKTGLVEMMSDNIMDDARLQLTDKGKALFFEADIDLFEEQVGDKELIDCSKIAEKRLFFEPSLDRQLSMLRSSLEEKNYLHLCERLKSNNLPTGVAVLLYGLPGTGKTESVMQIAKATGRSIMHVDISATKSCWFGESEKLIKGVFEKYRSLCRKSKLKPILLFNEADAIFAKRKDTNSSNVAQTENAIQNIILEEMENLDGILIATTNLADNLDKAFERRFLFKIRYDKPAVECKISIWRDKMPRLTEKEAMRLASSYEFSGGEIDNIVRKAIMEDIINGVSPTLDRLITLCNEEKIGKNSKKIGF